MRFVKTMVGGVFAAAMALPTLMAADGEVPDVSLGDWEIGETVRGEAVKAKELTGKVVVIEYWGVN